MNVYIIYINNLSYRQILNANIIEFYFWFYSIIKQNYMYIL